MLGWVEDPDSYPIQPKPHTFEFLREVAHLRPRTNVIAAVTRARHTLAQAIHRFFDERGFWVNTPIITAADAEGAGALFRVSTLDLANIPRQGDRSTSPGFLRTRDLPHGFGTAQRGGLLPRFPRSTFGPTFRAENSNTSRHLAEFWMIEPEIAFADLADNADLAEALLKSVFSALLKKDPTTWRSSTNASRRHCGEVAGHHRFAVRAHGLRRGDLDPRARRKNSSSR